MLREEVQSFLRTKRIRLATDLGQHFLIDDDILSMIVETAELSDRDNILEVGPGIGILTRELVKRAGHVTAVELDRRFPPLLRAFTKNPKNLSIIEGNALHVPLPTNQSYKIVANIPYHITSPLLHRFLLEETNRPISMTLLIQREVAENICSEETASILSLLVRLFGVPRIICDVPPDAFLPPPAVDSAVLAIELSPKPKGSKEIIDTALMLLKHASRERRKMLRNTIAHLPNGERAMKRAEIDPMRRPQTLTVDEWVGLAGAFNELQ